MIRTIPIPRGRMGRVGLIGAGSGGSAFSYSFDADGLSNDPRLAAPLQNLTSTQLQSALNGEDPYPDLSSLVNQDITATGAGSLPCGTPDTPTCGPDPTGNNNATFLYIGIGIAVLFLFTMRGR